MICFHLLLHGIIEFLGGLVLSEPWILSLIVHTTLLIIQATEAATPKRCPPRLWSHFIRAGLVGYAHGASLVMP